MDPVHSGPPFARALAALTAALSLLAACGAGTAGIVAGASGSGGSSTPALNAFVVETPKVSPTRLRLDASKAVQAALFYDAGAGEQPMTQLGGGEVAGNEVSLPAGVTELDWDFATELGDASFKPDVHLTAKLPGGTPLSGGELTLGMGNDPPVVVSVDPTPTNPADPSESSGNVEVRLVVSDSSSDVVAIHVDWRRASDASDAWQPATAAGVFPGGVETTPKGVTLSFFWNTNVDLFQGEDDVLLQITADDGTLDESHTPIGISAPVVSTLFHIDNNSEPSVAIDSGFLLTNSDQRRGLPIPFHVSDQEGDEIRIAFQWRRPQETFPQLPDGVAAVLGILADPVRRREFHVCTELPTFAQGCVAPIPGDSRTLRLPELASGEAWLLAHGIKGRELELLWPSTIPEPVASTWRQNPLSTPVAALPLAGGLTALILDSPDGWRLREIELATGAITREIATGPGRANAMTLEAGTPGGAILGSDDGGTWRIERVDLGNGSTRPLLEAGPTGEPGPVRAIASLGKGACLFTVGSSLVHLDYGDPTDARAVPVLTGLSVPWGLAVDPSATNRIYMSERNATGAAGTGRILALELDTHTHLPLVVAAQGINPPGLELPEAIALERNGTRLLAISSIAGVHQLVGIDVGATGGNAVFLIGSPLPADTSGLAVGSDDRRLLTFPLSDDIAVGGGVQQRRLITSYDSHSQQATIEGSLDPTPHVLQPWRVYGGLPIRPATSGFSGNFVWDTTDLDNGGSVFVRATPFDAELGNPSDSTATKSILAPLQVEASSIGGPLDPDGPESVRAADLDGDGDSDLASANPFGSNLTIYFQSTPGTFNLSPLILGNSSITKGPSSIATADFDGDGDVDLLSANETGNNLTLFFQDSRGGFNDIPLIIGRTQTTRGPVSCVAADVDDDGKVDVASANRTGNNLTIFFQSPAGLFDSAPVVLGSSSLTRDPRSIVAGDFDGDADIDIGSANSLGSNLTIFNQQAPRIFGSAPLVLGDAATTLNPVSVSTADMDGDGDLDVASTNAGGDNVTIFSQAFRGAFNSKPLVIGGASTIGNPVPCALADVNGDGNIDLVSGSSRFKTLAVFAQHSSGDFDAPPLLLTGAPSQPSSVAAADLNGDGRVDIFSSNQALDGLGVSNLAVFLQRSSGTFGSDFLVLGSPTTTIRPLALSVNDFDSDGDLDMASANSGDLLGNGASIALSFQGAPGVFGQDPEVFATPLSLPDHIASADLDGDGDIDLVASSLASENIALYVQSTPGLFRNEPLFLVSTGFSPTSVTATDVDNDGDLDLASTNSSAKNIIMFMQTGVETWEQSSSTLGGPLTTSNPLFVSAGDLDSDGDNDLVSANGSGNNVTVFFQVALGAFDSEPLALGGPAITVGSAFVRVGDLENDGDLDIVSANRGGDSLSVFVQKRAREFALLSPLLGSTTTSDGPNCVACGDLDNDGDLDLVSANFVGGNLTGFMQNGAGIFDPNPKELAASPTVISPRYIDALDVDGDGDCDLCVADDTNNAIILLWGGR